ncbi:MAG: arylsulfatase [Pirellulales bacterium]|nr:arylsulfatase [Pirellulales bacterium]
MMFGRLFVACFAALAGQVLSASSVGAAESQRPNVVIILMDDMGFSDIGCYGSEIPTPNIDALAAGGVRFTQFYNTARCSPTRASLLTGLYPHQAGMGHLENEIIEGSKGTSGRLRDDCVTMAEVLGDAGYFTCMAGKWHLGQNHGTPPWERGFMRALNSPFGGIYFRKQNYRPEMFLDGKEYRKDDPIFGDRWYSTDLWTDWGLKFADEAMDAQQPFFLYLPYCAQHFPLMAPEPVIQKYLGKYREKGWAKLRHERHQRQIELGIVDPKWPLSEIPPDVPDWDSLSDQDKDRFDRQMAIYAAMLEIVDNNIGKLVGHLKDRGQLDNTLLVFLADNGGNAEGGPRGIYQGKRPGGPKSRVFLGQSWATLNNTPLRRYKHFTHEGGISTPLIVHWPAGIANERNGKLEKQPGHLVDLMATVVDVTGATYPEQYKGRKIQPMEGVSLRPALAGEPLQRENPIYWEHEGNRAIRQGNWKLVMKFKGPWELYDIEADRTEQHDLSAERPDLVKELGAQWDAWAKRADVPQWPGKLRTDWGEEVKEKPQEAAAG